MFNNTDIKIVQHKLINITHKSNTMKNKYYTIILIEIKTHLIQLYKHSGQK